MRIFSIFEDFFGFKGFKHNIRVSRTKFWENLLMRTIRKLWHPGCIWDDLMLSYQSCFPTFLQITFSLFMSAWTNLLIYLLLTQKSHSFDFKFQPTNDLSLISSPSPNSRVWGNGIISRTILLEIPLMPDVKILQIPETWDDEDFSLDISIVISIDLEWSGANVKEWHCDALLGFTVTNQWALSRNHNNDVKTICNSL